MRDDPGRVLDILEAIERIEKVAVRGISPEFRDRNPGIPWSDIIGLRNILIHHYFGIDRDAVWNVVEHDLPALKKTGSVPGSGIGAGTIRARRAGIPWREWPRSMPASETDSGSDR